MRFSVSSVLIQLYQTVGKKTTWKYLCQSLGINVSEELEKKWTKVEEIERKRGMNTRIQETIAHQQQAKI